MKTYLFKVSGIVRIEAPNIAQAWKYIRQDSRLHEIVRISAGSATMADHPWGRNIDYAQYRVSAFAVKDTKQIGYIGTASADLTDGKV